jgi:hypothetical protein
MFALLVNIISRELILPTYRRRAQIGINQGLIMQNFNIQKYGHEYLNNSAI